MFGAKTTAEEVIETLGVSLTNKNVFVTGASSGIGVETARVLAKAGANVWLAGRDVHKTQQVASNIATNDLGGDASRLQVMELDLSDLHSVRACVDKFLALEVPLHILINNAGCMALNDRELTKDGFEMQIGTNHLGHFVLTNGLLPCLQRGAPSRIINVSSMAHHRSGIHFDNLQFETNYDPWTAYGQSKTANILHAMELNFRYGSEGITAVSLHPGVIGTELWRHTGNIMKMNKSIPQGAATTVYCAVANDVEGGKFYNDCRNAEVNPHASSLLEAHRLWDISESLTAQK